MELYSKVHEKEDPKICFFEGIGIMMDLHFAGFFSAKHVEL